MNTGPKVILITGATGFLGRELCQYFDKRGYQVRALVRDLKKAESLRSYAKGGIYRCALPDDIDPGAFKGEIEALIHCAYASQALDKKSAEAINLQGSKQLVDFARSHSVRCFVFISSLSAHDQAESYYGQSKLRIERLLDVNRDLIIRPGLIVGNGGLFARMQRSLKQLPLVPLFFGGEQAVQTIDIADLCEAIERAISRKFVGLFKVAVNQAIPIKDFYQSLAAGIGKKCHFVRLPGTISLWALRLIEYVGFNLPVNSENLLGLKHMKVFDTSSDLALLGINPISSNSELSRKLPE